MTRPQTHIEYEILQKDALAGIHYSSFEDFWEKRMEPMQFISREVTGVLKVLRDRLKDQALEQWILWTAHQIPKDKWNIPNVQSGV